MCKAVASQSGTRADAGWGWRDAVAVGPMFRDADGTDGWGYLLALGGLLRVFARAKQSIG